MTATPDNKRIEADGGKIAEALRGKVLGRRRSCVVLAGRT